MDKEQKEFEKYRAGFKAKYDIDIDLDTYRKIMSEERRAKKAQAEAGALDLGSSAVSCEENNAKCFSCSAGLSTIEVMLYGNRCVFCAEQKSNVNLFLFLLRCFYDWKIYQELIKLKSRTDLLGCLGVLGFVDINQVKTIRAKKALLKELRGLER